jgi:hypothetical protein
MIDFMPHTASRALVRQTERWFVRCGTPSMIEGYGFAGHVLPRMLPSLAFVALASLAWLVPLRAAGSGRWFLLAAVVVVTVGVRVMITAVVPRLPRFSGAITVAILIGYAAMPVIVPLLQLAVDGTITPPGNRAVGLLGFVIFFAVVFLATLGATTYGLGVLLRLAVRHARDDLRNSVRLLGRVLPTLLFITLFLFFTGELWQAMNRITWWRLALVVALFAAVAVLSAAARLRDEISRVEQDLSWPRLAAACQGTPLAEIPIEQVTAHGPLHPVSLNGRQSRNLLLMLATRQLVQAVLVGVALFTVFVLLGALVVDPETAEQWIGAVPASFPLVPALPLALVHIATLFGGFGSMYFVVTSMSDPDHRQQFFGPIVDDIERVLAVRAVYLAVHDRNQSGMAA